MIRAYSVRRGYMHNTSHEVRDIGRFVRARREATSADSYSEIPARRRHVQHLTQSDLADLVGVSTVVISQIEQGRYQNLNASILKKISRVLRFSAQQEMYALGLLSPRADVQKSLEPAPGWVIASIADIPHPAFVLNPAYDLVSWNSMAETMLGQYASRFLGSGNGAVSVFRIPEMRDFFVDWSEYSSSLVSGMRMAYSLHTEYRDYVVGLAESLARVDEVFNRLWARDDALVKPTILKELAHPTRGRLRMFQVVTDIVEAPYLNKLEFIPADEETTEKLKKI